MKSLSRALVFTALATLLGCATADVTTLKSAPPKHEDCDIDLFASEKDIKRPFETVCLITANTGSSVFEDRTMNGAISEIRPKACACGADAIVLMNGESGGWNAMTGNKQGHATVKAVRYQK